MLCLGISLNKSRRDDLFVVRSSESGVCPGGIICGFTPPAPAGYQQGRVELVKVLLADLVAIPVTQDGLSES